MLAVPALVLGLTACGGPTTHVRPGSTSTGPSAASTWAGKSYVALGDSYTSAPNVGGRDAVSGRVVCGQSRLNYPHRLAIQLGLQLEDVSCGGAATDDMTQRQSVGGTSVPPQLDALRASTDLVSIGIGGNDGQVMQLLGSCSSLAHGDPHGDPCTQRLDQAGAWLARLQSALQKRVVTVLAEIGRRAPRAKVLVVGYPQIIGADGGCSRLPLATGDAATVRKVVRADNTSLARAAARAGATYVDTWTATAGHGICSTDPWIAGITPTEPAAPLHPYAAEQAAVARQIEAALS
ncbi:SGNH/GDSL hydrolase family protein [Nocardioides montaniterrae]